MPMDQEQLTTMPPVLEFDGKRASFVKVLIVNGILTILSLGIYRFWAKTKVRRFFWSNVRFLDDPLEYTGTGGELFVGFLIVIAILFPLGLIYSAIGSLVPPDATELRVGLEVAYYLVIFALLQIGFYRMWRYRMSRTTWRGVRFGLDGSTWTYLKLASGWTLLSAITLGFAYPWMQIDLWRYQIRHTRIGSEVFKFKGNAKDLMWPWVTVYIPMICIAGAGIGIMLSFESYADNEMPTMIAGKEAFVEVMGTLIGISLLAFFIAFFVYQVRQTRYQISGVKLGIASFTSMLPIGRLFIFAALSFLLMGAVILLPFMMYLGPDFDLGFFPYADAPEPATFSKTIAPILFMFISVVFIFPLIWSVLFKFEVIKQMVITTSIENAEVLEQAAQSASETPRTGEGLADALDIGGF